MSGSMRKAVRTESPSVSGLRLHRRCACGQHTAGGGECDACRKKRLESSGGAVAPGIVHEVLSSPGRPLDPLTRASLESGFDGAGISLSSHRRRVDAKTLHPGELPIVPAGDSSEAEADRAAERVAQSFQPGGRTEGSRRFRHDFSGVRVHTDGQAARSAEAVDAAAYTVGQHVVFGAGRYAPETGVGRALLGHELAHVGQQEDGLGRQALWRKGATLGGFFRDLGRGIASIFTDEPAYDETTLRAYLKTLTDTKDIEDDQDSDNKARAVVSKGLFKGTGLDIRILLIREMLSGFTGDDDEQAILEILKDATAKERKTVAERIGLEELYDNFHGSELDELYVVYPVLQNLHPRGPTKSKTYSLDEYIEKWEKENGRSLSPEEKKVLAKGCIGITMLALGTMSRPDLTNCYDTFAQVWEAAQKMNEFLAVHSPDRKALIFSKRFWSSGLSFEPDPATGKVDMSGYLGETRPEKDMTNFDYGLYDEKTQKWWHANHCDMPILANPRCKGPMKVYESNLQHYSRSLRDFDRQVFCVAITMK